MKTAADYIRGGRLLKSCANKAQGPDETELISLKESCLEDCNPSLWCLLHGTSESSEAPVLQATVTASTECLLWQKKTRNTFRKPDYNFFLYKVKLWSSLEIKIKLENHMFGGGRVCGAGSFHGVQLTSKHSISALVSRVVELQDGQ